MDSTFGGDVRKAALVAAIPCAAFDLIVFSPGGPMLLGFLLMVSLPVAIVAAVILPLFLSRKPAWLAGVVLAVALNSAVLLIAL